MWTEDTLLDAATVSIGSRQPLHVLREVEVEDRRIDAVFVVGDKRVGVEAKATRQSFRAESDAKRQPTERACNGCVYLSPPGVVEPRDLPYGWGLWHAVGPASIKVVVKPLWHGVHPFAVDHLATYLARRLADVERRVRVAERTGDPAGALVGVDREIERLQGVLATRDAAVARERARAQDAAEQVAALLGEQVCSACGAPITYSRTGAWRHDDRQQEASCERLRADEEKARREAATGCEYVAVSAPRVVPAQLSTDR